MRALKKVDYRILAELIKNSRLSDRQLAKNLGVSQPTVTRRRTMLEKERFVEYTAIPDLRKLGFEILAFNFANWKQEASSEENIQEAKAFISKHPSVMFVSTGRGLGADRVSVSAHRNYADYHRYIQELRQYWGANIERVDSFIVSLQNDNILRNLSFKYLAEILKQVEE
jgi:DNA-binding Lrp family transcriptional regulator